MVASKSSPVQRMDPVTLAVIGHGLVAAAEQMAVSVERSARSQVVREMLDYSTAIFDPRGRIVAQSAQIPIHLNSMSHSLRALLARFPLEQMQPGDVYGTNDPYAGGQHLPDLQTFAPVFVDDVCVALTGILMHHLDVGGRAAASYGADVTEIYQEGFRVPPLRLAEKGVVYETFLALFGANIRVPEKTLGDFSSQIAALTLGGKDIERVAHRYGADTVVRAMGLIIEASERRMRSALAQVPEGVYRAEDVVDGDGIDNDPVTVKVAVERVGDELIVDFTGSSPQTRGPINCPIAPTESSVYFAVTAMLDPGIPPDEGSYRPVRVIAPEGTVVNPRHPAPVVGRNVVAHRVGTVVMTALGKALPERAIAPYYGSSNVFVVSAYSAQGKANVHIEIEVGGWGARAWSDGPDCLSAGIHNLANNPIELVENDFPLRMLRYGRRPDSGGPGRYRGGLGLERSFEVLEDCELSTQLDRVIYPAPGLDGGHAGAGAQVWVERDGARQELASKIVSHRLRAGDRVTVLTQGGGGFGDPRERERAAIRRDVEERRVSAERAASIYGLDERGVSDGR